MARHVRLRCPICGMLTWQSRLDKEWPFEVIIQHIKGKGRGHGFSNRYYAPETEEGTWLLKLALIDKLEAVAEELRGEVRQEKDAIWSQLLSDGEYSDAIAVNSTYHAEFSEIGTAVKGFLSKMSVEVLPLVLEGEGPVRSPAGEGPAPVASRLARQLPLAFQVGIEEEDIEEETRSESADGALPFFTGSQGLMRSTGQPVKSGSSIRTDRVSSTQAQEEDGDDEVIVSGSRVEDEW